MPRREKTVKRDIERMGEELEFAKTFNVGTLPRPLVLRAIRRRLRELWKELEEMTT